MGATLSVFKTLFLPAVIAFIFFAFLTFALVPAWRYYRNRYGHYLPIETLSNQTSSLRYRMQSAIGRFFSRAAAARERASSATGGSGGNGGSSGSSGLFARLSNLVMRRSPVGTATSSDLSAHGHGRDHDHGHDDEGLLSDDDDGLLDGHGLGLHDPLGGEELSTLQPGRGRRGDGRGGVDHTQRLSRDLEQGFMDDSDEDEAPPQRR